ncbi:MAG: hypothetical protein A2341_17310 [Deltaproteobacteria bacterium RIFOXYB12_FULL_58_9]|nr:MAG: hypothetical protein A2341_17310 [Deltaproteobacteria bacterium RIFOXYB12_FULL_58_9]
MRHAVWIALGWLGVTFWTSLAARLSFGHLVPDAAVVTVVFLALRREPVVVTATALAIGYLVGRQALAPVGLHEVALVGCAVIAYLASGHIAGSGPAFLAVASAMGLVAYHVLLYLLLSLGRDQVGFSSWATAMLLPNAVITGVLAFVSYPGLAALERKLTPETHEGLAWR